MATLPAPRLTVVIALALATLSLAAEEVTITPANDLELHARSLQASCAGYAGKKKKCKRAGGAPPPRPPAPSPLVAALHRLAALTLPHHLPRPQAAGGRGSGRPAR